MIHLQLHVDQRSKCHFPHFRRKRIPEPQHRHQKVKGFEQHGHRVLLAELIEIAELEF